MGNEVGEKINLNNGGAGVGSYGAQSAIVYYCLCSLAHWLIGSARSSNDLVSLYSPNLVQVSIVAL